MDDPSLEDQATLFGHPVGLFTLFFAEMWERFSYYGMKALLVYYMIKDFLHFDDDHAYAVYGAYTSLVYATPFIGGMLADRLLGGRRAVILGGLLMSLGHLLMTVTNVAAFYTALALIVCGNGFFKPNVSTMVGSLYRAGSPRRDAGFTIFYMGINLGAALAPLVCGYVGEHFGWHYGFGLATVGMLTGLAVFVAPNAVTQLLIALSALGTSVGLFIWQENVYQLAVNGITAVALLAAAAVACLALGRGGLPAWAGQPKDRATLRYAPLIYLGVLVAIPVLALLLQHNFLARAMLFVAGAVAFSYLIYEAIWRCTRVERERILVALLLMCFVMVFWMCFEQAGSSISNFTDRNIQRVVPERQVSPQEVGQTLQLKLTQEQLGHQLNGQMLTMSALDKLRSDKQDTVTWTVAPADVGMGVGGSEIPASQYQAANPIFILLFGLLFSWMWVFLGQRRCEPSTPIKFSLGLLQLGLGFVALWYGARHCDERGMVSMSWLILSYLLQTTGELCLSPVGLSMVTRMAPARLVGTVMGAWFLSTALANSISAIVASFTSSTQAEGTIPPPLQTVHVYGRVFGAIGLVAIGAAALCWLLAPLINRWMHEDQE